MSTQKGLWPCHVSIPLPVKSKPALSDCCQCLCGTFPTLRVDESFLWLPFETYHISLTQTLMLQRHEFESLQVKLSALAKRTPRFFVALKDSVVLGKYFAFRVDDMIGGSELRALVDVLDKFCAASNVEGYHGGAVHATLHCSVGEFSRAVGEMIPPPSLPNEFVFEAQEICLQNGPNKVGRFVLLE